MSNDIFDNKSDVKLLFDFKIAVFDLDETLWDGTKLFYDTQYILSTLKSCGIKLYIASFHLDARTCCKDLNIEHYFDDILYGRDKTKLEMIKIIINKFGADDNIAETDVIFFDDNQTNITDVKKNSSIKTVLVGTRGINWNYIKYRIAIEPVKKTSDCRNGQFQLDEFDYISDIYVSSEFNSITDLPDIETTEFIDQMVW
jgi:FMN phosphatase YigB (HAD superfamily)